MYRSYYSVPYFISPSRVVHAILAAGWRRRLDNDDWMILFLTLARAKGACARNAQVCDALRRHASRAGMQMYASFRDEWMHAEHANVMCAEGMHAPREL